MSVDARPRTVNLLGIDIGGTKCAVVLGEYDGDTARIVGRVATPTRTGRDPLEALAELEGLCRNLLGAAGLEPRQVAQLGVCCGGPLDDIGGTVLGPPNLPGWDHVPVVDFFEQRLGIPTRLANDANAGAVAEWRWGAGRGMRTMVFLTFGTGLGAGLIVDGRVHRGARGLAGEVGHIRMALDGPFAYGKNGSWEGYSSGAGIRRMAVERVRDAWANGRLVAFCPDETALEALDVPAIAAAARLGDQLAKDIFLTSGMHLGRGIAILADVIDPELVVVGGIYGRCLDLLEGPTIAAFSAEALVTAPEPNRIVPAQLGEAIGDFSALAVASTDTERVVATVPALAS
jgi:glucokinase